MPTTNFDTAIPSEAVIHQEVEFKLRNGRDFVKIRTIDMQGLIEIANAIQRANLITDLMGTVNFRQLLSQDQIEMVDGEENPQERGKLIGKFMASLPPEKRILITQAAEKRIAAFFRVPEIAQQLVVSCSNLTIEGYRKLHPIDAMKLISEIIKINEVGAMIEAGVGFFSEIGGLMDQAFGKASQAQASEPQS